MRTSGTVKHDYCGTHDTHILFIYLFILDSPPLCGRQLTVRSQATRGRAIGFVAADSAYVRQPPHWEAGSQTERGGR